MNAEKINKPEAATAEGWFSRQVTTFENNRYWWMALFITAQSCLGSAACMYILHNKASDLMLVSCAAVTMGCNAVLIAQGPGKWCLLSVYISVIANLFFIILNV